MNPNTKGRKLQSSDFKEFYSNIDQSLKYTNFNNKPSNMKTNGYSKKTENNVKIAGEHSAKKSIIGKSCNFKKKFLLVIIILFLFYFSDNIIMDHINIKAKNLLLLFLRMTKKPQKKLIFPFLRLTLFSKMKF